MGVLVCGLWVNILVFVPLEMRFLGCFFVA